MQDQRGRGGDSAEEADLRERADRVHARLDEVARADEPGFEELVGIEEIVGALARLEPGAQRSVWNMQTRLGYDPEDPGYELTASSLQRGIQTMLVTTPASQAMNPLLSSLYPWARLGPVFLRAAVVDEERVVVEGRMTADGSPTAWLTERAEVVDAVCDVWVRTLALSRPVLPLGEQPPLTHRQLQVARLIALGEKDQSIARQLDMSARTVERDVRTILVALGVSSRTEAVLTMIGRGRNGGRRSRERRDRSD